MRQIGIIIEEQEDGKALVEVNRSSACEGCSGCGVFSDSLKIRQFQAENEKHYPKGERVILEIENSRFFLLTFSVYVLPVLGLIAGYYFGGWIHPKLSIDFMKLEDFSILMSFITAGLFFSFIPFYEKSFGKTTIKITGKAEGSSCKL